MYYNLLLSIRLLRSCCLKKKKKGECKSSWFFKIFFSWPKIKLYFPVGKTEMSSELEMASGCPCAITNTVAGWCLCVMWGRCVPGEWVWRTPLATQRSVRCSSQDTEGCSAVALDTLWHLMCFGAQLFNHTWVCPHRWLGMVPACGDTSLSGAKGRACHWFSHCLGLIGISCSGEPGKKMTQLAWLLCGGLKRRLWRHLIVAF